jgi:hypothetical protein
MAAGLVDRVLHMSDVVGLIDAEAAKIPAVRRTPKFQTDALPDLHSQFTGFSTGSSPNSSTSFPQPVHRLVHDLIPSAKQRPVIP